VEGIEGGFKPHTVADFWGLEEDGGHGIFTFVDLPFASFDTWRMSVVYVIT